MNWIKLKDLLRDCSLKPAAEVIDQTIPADYRSFLQIANGAEGFLTPTSYIMLWSAEEVVTLNDAYGTTQYLPGVFLIGTDGGDTGFGVDLKTGRYLKTPLIGMSRLEVVELGNSLEEMVEQLTLRRA